MRASGQSGELRHYYQVAARIGAWVISRADDGGYRFVAPLREHNTVWLAERPLDLIIALGQVEWIWRGIEPRVDGTRIHIALTHRPDVVGSVAATLREDIA